MEKENRLNSQLKNLSDELQEIRQKQVVAKKRLDDLFDCELEKLAEIRKLRGKLCAK